MKCQSPWNTPLLTVKKPGTHDYHLVQHLRAVNKAAFTLHPAVLNLYTLLGLIPSTADWFTCLDLKDAFVCLWVAPVSQLLFAFEWENPHTGDKEPLTWKRLPQGFKNSSTLFSRGLAANLANFSGQELDCVLLQYVNDLLLARTTQTCCLEGTKALFSLLIEAGYQVSKEKGTPERHCPQMWNASDHRVGQWTGTCSRDSIIGGKGFEDSVEIAYCLPAPELRESGTRDSNLKQTLAKLCQGNSLPWVGMLPMALLKVRCPPWAEIGFSPLEILYE